MHIVVVKMIAYIGWITVGTILSSGGGLILDHSEVSLVLFFFGPSLVCYAEPWTMPNYWDAGRPPFRPLVMAWGARGSKYSIGEAEGNLNYGLKEKHSIDMFLKNIIGSISESPKITRSWAYNFYIPSTFEGVQLFFVQINPLQHKPPYCNRCLLTLQRCVPALAWIPPQAPRFPCKACPNHHPKLVVSAPFLSPTSNRISY